jgi:opacity protein-like surface antigen
MMRAVTLSIALALMLGSTPARAQSPPSSSSPAPATIRADRAFVSINGGYRPASASFTDTVRVTQNVEPGTIDTAYRVKAAPNFDVAGGVRIWRQLAVAVDVAYFSKAAGGTVSAQIPHPFFFGRPRTVQGEAPGLSRQEIAVHGQLVWMMPVGNPRGWRFGVAGGPSFFTLRQQVVQDVTVTDTYPFDTATLATVVSQRVEKSRVGFNVGADLSYMLSPTVGIGTTVMFSRARVSLPSGGHDLSVDAGGVRIGAGLRFRF